MQDPRQYANPAPNRLVARIGLIGCGAISERHLRAYKAANFDVVALCSRTTQKMELRRREFAPEASLYQDYRELLKRDDISVVDITTHATDRPPIIRAALEYGKHVLSQKPFVTDLDTGEQLVELADAEGLRLAVAHNCRWIPPFPMVRQMLVEELLGAPTRIELEMNWNHNWIKGSPFDGMKHVILYDFGIHWFDLIAAMMKHTRPARVEASVARSETQIAAAPLVAKAEILYEGAHVTLAFNGDTTTTPLIRTHVEGPYGYIRSEGPNFAVQRVECSTTSGTRVVHYDDDAQDGFQGPMGELLCAIEDARQPENNARDNLRSLELCFAAIESADRAKPVVPGTIRRLPAEHIVDLQSAVH